MAKHGTKILSGVLALALLISVFAPFTFIRTRSANAVIATVTPVPSPLTVNSTAQYTWTFTIGQGLAAGVDTITITFPSGTVLPATIVRSTISVNGLPLTVDPTVNTSLRTVLMVVPSTTPAGAAAPSIGCGVDTICGNADDPAATAVTVFFSQTAGVVNPAQGGLAGTAGAATAGAAQTSREAAVNVAAAQQVNYTRTLAHSVTSGARGTNVTSTASGFVANSTVSVFFDTNASGTFNAGEPVLGSAAAGSNGVATVTWAANVPPLAAGANANIRAVDNSGATNAPNVPAATFTVSRSVTLSRTSGPAGTAITLTGQDFTAGEAIDGADVDVNANDGITIAGLSCGPAAAVAATATGTLPATAVCTVPIGSPLGTSTVRVFTAGAATAGATATFTITGAPVTVSPTSAVPGQPVVITATGLTAGAVGANAACNAGVSCVLVGGISIAGAGWNAAVIQLDTAGNLPATSLNIGANATTTAPGTYQVVVTDDDGLSGTASITIPGRSISISPNSSRRGSVVTVTGSGFTRNSAVIVSYAGVNQTSALSDGNGNFSANLTIPSTTAIPSTNAVTAADSSALANQNSVTHDVPSPTITVSATTVPIGSALTIDGSGFPGFSAIGTLTIGGLNVLPVGGINTVESGAFSATVMVPAQTVGAAAVQATAGGVNATATVTVTAASATVQTQMQPLIAANQLTRAWAWDNAAKTWRLFDPTAPAAANDLTVLARGQAVNLVVTANATLVTSSFTYTLTAGNNIIGWQGP
jgi:hypothetical protein